MGEAAALPGETTLSSLWSCEALDLCTSQVGAAASRSSPLHRALQRSSCPSQRRRHWHFFRDAMCMVSHDGDAPDGTMLPSRRSERS